MVLVKINRISQIESAGLFEVLGSWMACLCMWQLGLGIKLFEDDVTLEVDTKVVLWRTGRRIKYNQNW